MQITGMITLMLLSKFDVLGYPSYNENLKNEGRKIMNLTTSMKFTGMVRKVDELGRVVIPIELRRILEIKEKDALEIHVDGERIVLKKYDPTCIFTGEVEETICYKNKIISRKCIEEMYALLQSKKAPVE
jgi:AbrB family transcriptional regulator, transcriptional pleiotropic regulator of transition state genes